MRLWRGCPDMEVEPRSAVVTPHPRMRKATPNKTSHQICAANPRQINHPCQIRRKRARTIQKKKTFGSSPKPRNSCARTAPELSQHPQNEPEPNQLGRLPATNPRRHRAKRARSDRVLSLLYNSLSRKRSKTPATQVCRRHSIPCWTLRARLTHTQGGPRQRRWTSGWMPCRVQLL